MRTSPRNQSLNHIGSLSPDKGHICQLLSYPWKREENKNRQTVGKPETANSVLPST